jgi:hypothetical protein
LLKFPIDTPFEKLKVFKGCLEKFVSARPREWISMSGFRATRVEADLGFVEYIVVAQHRDSCKWSPLEIVCLRCCFIFSYSFLLACTTGQNTGALKNSLAELSSFALELTKKMNMRYTSPPLPVDLSVIQRDGDNIDTPMDLLNAVIAGNQEFDGGGGENKSHDSHGSTDYAAISAMFDKK